jgi:hypothetical protein
MVDNGLRTVKAAVETIDCQNRVAKAIDEAGIFYILKWRAGYLDEKMVKLKISYYREFSGEMSGEDLILNSVKWIEKSEIPDWVNQRYKKSGGGGSSRQYVPRNEKPMVYESAFKSCVDLVRPDDFPGMPFSQRVEAVRVEADKIAKWIVQNGGA